MEEKEVSCSGSQALRVHKADLCQLWEERGELHREASSGGQQSILLQTSGEYWAAHYLGICMLKAEQVGLRGYSNYQSSQGWKESVFPPARKEKTCNEYTGHEIKYWENYGLINSQKFNSRLKFALVLTMPWCKVSLERIISFPNN